MKTVEFPYYLGDQIIKLIMYDDGTYDYEFIIIKQISIDENENIGLYYGNYDDDFICYTSNIDSYKELITYLDEVYIFSSLDKMNAFIISLRSN